MDLNVEALDAQDAISSSIEHIVPKTDDPNTPAFTFRALFLGCLFGIGLSLANSVWAFRTNASISTSGATFAVVASYPLGILWSRMLRPHPFWNPGKFSIKEHVVIYVLTHASSVPYGMENVVSQAMPTLMNNENITFFHALAFVFVTQFTGFGFAGLCRRFLVKPSAMLWPTTFSTLALFASFHNIETPSTANKRVSVMSNFNSESTKAEFIIEDGIDMPPRLVEQSPPMSTSSNSLLLKISVPKLRLDGLAGNTVESPRAPIAWKLNNVMTIDSLNPVLNSVKLFNGNPNSTTHKLGSVVNPSFFYNVSSNYDLNSTAYEDISGIGISISVLAEFLMGSLVPGQTVAVMAFKSLALNNLNQGILLVSGLKLGHYLHVPPAAIVAAQFLGTFINAIASTSVTWIMMFHSGNLLNASHGEWQYIVYQTFYSDGAIWGAIGPRRFFGVGSLYEGLFWCFLIGFLCPLGPWLCDRYVYPATFWKHVNFPIIFAFAGVGGFQNMILSAMLVGFVFQVVVFRYWKQWYHTYNFVMASGFDMGLGIAVLSIAILGIAGLQSPYGPLNPNLANVPLDY
ncbi:UNVERIFIED_CONTAM: hypothetical protein HDU68_000197 [Siphonaria sp. JEL0065]|nr:hypothetical protein HDU68_000197 [Siphonaria sp. JEL0065]